MITITEQPVLNAPVTVVYVGRGAGKALEAFLSIVAVCVCMH